MIPFKRVAHPESRGEDEEWAGMSNAAARRKLQNRLNQRAYRKRRAEARRLNVSRNLERTALTRALTPSAESKAEPSPDEAKAADKTPNAAAATTSALAEASMSSDDSIILRRLLNPKIRECWQYAAKVIWPGCGHVVLNGGVTTANSFFKSGLRNDMLFHAQSWATFLHLNMRRPEEGYLTLALQHQLEAIRLVNGQLSHYSAPASDELILAVTLLMCDGSVPSSDGPIFGGFRPILTHLQWLNVTGRMSWLESHKSMLRKLVEERGGLDELKMPGLAEHLQRFDIVDISRAISKPNFPLCTSYRYIYENEMVAMRGSPRGSEQTPNFLFNSVDLDEEFVDLLWDMRTYIDLMELHCDGLYVNPDAARLATQRNVIQHRLLSLSTESASPSFSMCRVAALIFCFGVLYPIPDARPLTRLCVELAWMLASKHDLSHEMLFWVTMLGGIAAQGGEREGFYLDRLSQLVGLSKASWPDTKEIFRGFLWYDRACDPAAMKIFFKVHAQIQGSGEPYSPQF